MPCNNLLVVVYDLFFYIFLKNKMQLYIFISVDFYNVDVQATTSIHAYLEYVHHARAIHNAWFESIFFLQLLFSLYQFCPFLGFTGNEIFELQLYILAYISNFFLYNYPVMIIAKTVYLVILVELLFFIPFNFIHFLFVLIKFAA